VIDTAGAFGNKIESEVRHARSVHNRFTHGSIVSVAWLVVVVMRNNLDASSVCRRTPFGRI
jgi:hypothetical protein